ncbi:phage tail length tape measure family protein [Tatumella sp. JGM118]|uniref:phage tail length tape measure family protein n=1 Tax=Tatumella sp. JGM118 TaxID=2799796 RepID=UPI001BAFA105|nr:phage tail length tape measure family protein [Tatumella sp. JGM118]MBS0909218.1 phage tail length tape measure family protein [Tatumella sp. JGM118]
MAEQTSRLAVIIDSSGAQKSAETLTSALVNLSQEGKKAETATDNLSSATKDLNSWLKQGPKAASDASKAIEDEAKSLNSLLEKIRPTNKALSQLDSMSKQLSQSFSKGLINESQFNTYDKILGNLVDKYEKVDDELTGIAQAEREAAAAAKATQKAHEAEALALQKMLDKLDPVSASVRRLEQDQQSLQSALSSGKISGDEYDKYSESIARARKEVTGEAQAERDAAKAREQQEQSFQRMLDKIDPVSSALRNLEKQQNDLSAALSSGKISADQYGLYAQKVDDARREVNGEAQAERDAAKAHDAQVASLQRLVAQLDPLGESFRKLSQQQQQLDDAKSSGMLSTDRYTELSAALTKTRDELQKTAEVSHTTAHAMQMLPMQMSYILSGLASGQSPFMVLIQQGGWLTGMFGGLGATIKGVGAYVAGLVNPFTVAAAAVGVLGLAYYEGAAEQEEFRKSLILTGNQVGKTSGQLSEIAATISTATGTTQGQAASVINQVVSAGNIAGDSLQKVSAAIVSISDATGQATDKLVSDFSNIANDPVAAITKLNDQYHFLTLATYNQIKALQDEGDQQYAAKVANDAYANALTQRAGEIKNSLGTLETIWNSVGEAAKGAWDSMLDIGRGQTLQQQIANVQKQISDIQGNVKPGAFGLGGVGDDGVQNKQLAALKSQLLFLQSQATTQDVLNGFVDKHNQAQQAGIKAQEYIDNLQQQSLSNAEKRTKEQNLLTEALKKTRAAGTSISAAEEAQLRQDIDNKYKDPAAPKQRQGKAYTEDAGSRLLEQINQQSAALVSQLNTTEKLSSVTQQRIKFEQQIADIRQRVAQNQPITADQRSLLSQQSEIEQAYKRQEALQKSVTTLDDYRKMMLEIEPKEQKQNDTLQKRLKILQDMVALKRLSPEEAGSQAGEIIGKSALPDAVIQGVNAAGGTLKSGATNSDLSDQGNGMFGIKSDPQLETIQKLKKAQTAYASWLNEQEKAINQSSFGNEKQRQDRLAALKQTGTQNQIKLSTALHVSEMSSAETSFSTITDSMGTMFGQQSGMYKAAFATQKAFAIAQAGIQLPMAMAQAMANLPFPANLAAVANVVALMSTITSSITSVAANGFQSGGYTGNGGVSDIAGVVHGQEFVMDAAATKRIGVSNLEAIRRNGLDATLSRSGFGTGAKNVSNNQSNVTHLTVQAPPITINGNPSDSTIQLVQQAAKQGAQQGYKMVAGDLAAGKGQVHKSLTAGYNTSRRTG